MENKRFWIFLAFGVLVAMSFRFLDVTHHPANLGIWKTDKIAEETSMSGPRHLMHFPKGSHLADRPRATLPMVAGLTPAPAAPAVTKAPAAAKKDDKKKKKKKKKAEVKPVAAAPVAPASDENKSASGDDNSASGAATVVSSGGVPAGAGKPNNGIPQTLQEWEDRLLKQPDFKETTLFISLYQTNQVSSAVFYTVVGEMLGDQRSAMQQLGVIALGATPSVTSYLVLDNSIGNLQSGPRAQALNYLNGYASLSRLPILASVLQSGVSPQAMLEAIQILDASAKRNLGSSTTSSSVNGTPAAGTQTGTSGATSPTGTTTVTAANILKVQKYFAPFLPLLQKIAAKSGSSSLRSYASQEYSYLESILASATAAASTPTAASPNQVATQQQEAAL
jgi:hypothetical protein